MIKHHSGLRSNRAPGVAASISMFGMYLILMSEKHNNKSDKSINTDCSTARWTTGRLLSGEEYNVQNIGLTSYTNRYS